MILIDDGTGSSSLISHPPLSSLGILCRLSSPPLSDARADIAFDGCGPDSSTIRVGIEVKHETELISALKSGRFQATQLPALLYLYDIRWLIILTGQRRPNPTTGVLQVRRYIDGNPVWIDWAIDGTTVSSDYTTNFLSSPSFCEFKDDRGEGVRYHMVFGEKEAARWIGNLYHIWQRPYESHKSMRVLDRSGNQNGLTDQAVRTKLRSLHDPRLNDPKFMARVRIASSLPDISYHRAVAMAERFESGQAMLSPMCTCGEGLTNDERREREKGEERAWQEVDKVGKVIAARIGKAVR